MRKVLGIARYTFTEIFRNKVYYVLLLFGGVLIFSSLLLGALGGEQKARMIVDLGLVGIETFCLVIGVFAAVTLVLQEMESRTLYLILTRPVARYQFILGRFLGLTAIISTTMIVMAAGHLLLLISQGIMPTSHYGFSLLYSWEKLQMITGIAILFSLFATSTVSALSFTFFFWVMGHVSSEIRFLAHQAHQPLVTLFCDLFYYLAPNFEKINIRDLNPAMGLSRVFLLEAFGYGLCYVAICLGLTSFLFRRKEF